MLIYHFGTKVKVVDGRQVSCCCHHHHGPVSGNDGAADSTAPAARPVRVCTTLRPVPSLAAPGGLMVPWSHGSLAYYPGKVPTVRPAVLHRFVWYLHFCLRVPTMPEITYLPNHCLTCEVHPPPSSPHRSSRPPFTPVETYLFFWLAVLISTNPRKRPVNYCLPARPRFIAFIQDPASDMASDCCALESRWSIASTYFQLLRQAHFAAPTVVWRRPLRHSSSIHPSVVERQMTLSCSAVYANGGTQEVPKVSHGTSAFCDTPKQPRPLSNISSARLLPPPSKLPPAVIHFVKGKTAS